MYWSSQPEIPPPLLPRDLWDNINRFTSAMTPVDSFKGFRFRKKVTPSRTIFMMINFFSPPHNNPYVILYKQKGVSFVGFLCVLTHIAHCGTLMHGVSEAIATNYSFSRWKTSAVIRLFGFSEEERVSSSETQYRVAYIFSPSHSIRNVSILHFNYFHHHRGPYSFSAPSYYFKHNQHIRFIVIIIIIIIIIIVIIIIIIITTTTNLHCSPSGKPDDS